MPVFSASIDAKSTRWIRCVAYWLRKPQKRSTTPVYIRRNWRIVERVCFWACVFPNRRNCGSIRSWCRVIFAWRAVCVRWLRIGSVIGWNCGDRRLFWIRLVVVVRMRLSMRTERSGVGSVIMLSLVVRICVYIRMLRYSLQGGLKIIFLMICQKLTTLTPVKTNLTVTAWTSVANFDNLATNIIPHHWHAVRMRLVVCYFDISILTDHQQKQITKLVAFTTLEIAKPSKLQWKIVWYAICQTYPHSDYPPVGIFWQVRNLVDSLFELTSTEANFTPKTATGEQQWG